MGWCQEFGAVIHPGCGHGMVAEPDHCRCPVCGVRCPGKFEACSDVWANGAPPVSLSSMPASSSKTAPSSSSPSPATPPPASSSPSPPGIDPSRTAAVAASPSPSVSGDDDDTLDQLRRMVAAMPRSIGAVLAEARDAQHQDLAATADRLAVALARRVGAEVDRLEAARITPLADSLAELAVSVQALHDRLDAVDAQRQPDTRVR